MEADSSVVIAVDMNVSDAEKELARLKKKVIKLESDLSESKYKKTALEKELENVDGKIEEIRNNSKDGILSANDLQKVEELNKNAVEIEAQIEKIKNEIDAGNIALDAAKKRYADVKQEQEELLKKKKKEAEEQERIAQEEQARIEAEKQAELERIEAERQAQAQADSEKEAALQRQKELERAQEQVVGTFVDGEQIDGATRMENAFARISNYIANLPDHLGLVKREVAETADKAEDVEDNIKEAKNSGNDFGEAMNTAGDFVDRLGKRIQKLAARVFVFTLITQALRQVKNWLGQVINTNDQARAAMARLQGALLTLAQPLVEVIIPAFTAFVNVLTAVISKIAAFISMLFGKTLADSAAAAKDLNKQAGASSGGLGKQAKAMKNVADAADEATGSLASFDETNTIATENAEDSPLDSYGGGGGGAGGLGDLAPDFDFLDGVSEKLKDIADLILLIAAGLALWKLGTMLEGPLGTILKLLGGILMTVGGLVLFWDGLTDAWENGVDWVNLIEMVGGLAAAAFGVYTVFGLISDTAGKMAAGIVLVVGGIAMLVTGFRDAMLNGWNLQNALLAIAGIVATGLGFFLITGSVIPAIIAGIAAVLLALTIATGNGEELIAGIQSVIQGFKDFFTGVFTGDMETAIQGIEEIFGGLGTAVGAVIQGLEDAFNAFLDWLDEKTGGRLTGIINIIKNLFHDAFTAIGNFISNLINGAKQIVQGFIEFLAGFVIRDLDTILSGLSTMFSGWMEILLATFTGVLDAMANSTFSVFQSIADFIYDAISNILDWLSTLWDSVGNVVSAIVDFFGGGSDTATVSLPVGAAPIALPEIPALAKGAVIPPNREFLAVLGDQTSGTNIEAPLATIEQALENVLARQGGGNNQPIEVKVMLDGKVLARAMVREVNDMTRAAGKPVLAY